MVVSKKLFFFYLGFGGVWGTVARLTPHSLGTPLVITHTVNTKKNWR